MQKVDVVQSGSVKHVHSLLSSLFVASAKENLVPKRGKLANDFSADSFVGSGD
jgi:hypothetical protein